MPVDQVELLSQRLNTTETSQTVISHTVESQDAKSILDSVTGDSETRMEAPMIPRLLSGMSGVFFAVAFVVTIAVFWSVGVHLMR